MSYYQAALKGIKTDLPHPHVDLTGKTIIVTGANAGLGKEVTLKLAAMKPSKLILAVRNASKGERARAEILAASSLDPSSVEVWILDMASFASVKAFGTRANAQLERLDVFVANAGIIAGNFEKTGDDWESSLQVNVLATYYLIQLILPLVQRTAALYAPPPLGSSALSKPHISIVSSGLHHIAKFKDAKADNILNTMNTDTASFVGQDRYMDTKVMEVYLVRELIKRSGNELDGIVINTSNPGWCHSELDASTKPNKIQRCLKELLARPTEMGARAITWAAVKGEKQGWYSTNCVDEEPAPAVTSPQGQVIQERLYNEVVEVLRTVDAET